MANTIKTNYQTELVALRAAQMAPYFTIGSKDYIGDQLVGKRNGQEYGFVIRDAGEVENQLEMGAGAKTNIVEREVKLSIEPWHITVKTNAIEGKTDLEFDKEVAEPNGLKLVQGALKKSIKKDVAKSATCFIGKVGEFEPLSMAAGHLSSITAEPLYGFCDPMIEAIVTSKGAQFVPVDAPPMYKQGLIGHFHGADYRSQRFIGRVIVSEAMGTAMNGAKFGGFAEGTNTLTITLGAAAGADFVVKAGTPFFVDGIVACDLVGDETTMPYAFIATEDVAVTKGASSISVKVDEVPVAAGGTRVAALADGGAIAWGSVGAKAVTCPEVGTYYGAIVRANGTYQFKTLDDLDVATAESTKGSVEGITIFTSRLVDLNKMVNDTRFDLFTISGTVEKRGQALVLVKAA
ncbi:MAG: hypothetical protein II304_00680 [Bacteroidales bacterium]|nr:hypothetical protein [Bacteroidales bacterium]